MDRLCGSNQSALDRRCEHNQLSLSFKFENEKIYISTRFIIFFLMYVFLAVLALHCCVGFSLVAASRGYSHGGARASHCGDFTCGAQGLGHVGFRRCSSQALEHRLSGCGASGPGIKRVSCIGRQSLCH